MRNIAKNDVTGRYIKSEPPNSAFRDGWDHIMNNKKKKMNRKLILASATWCGPCHGLKKRLQDNNLYDKVEIKDADKDQDFFKNHGIKSVPRLVIMDGDNEVESIQGIDDIYKAISDHSKNYD